MEDVASMNQGWSYENQVRKTDAGQTVLDFYQKFQHSTRAEWRSRILAAQILLEGQPTTPETILKPNQRLIYHRLPWVEPSVPLAFSILFQDEDVWAINKPSGLPVLPGGEFLEHTVLGQLRLRYAEAGLVPIHRLGRGTSGVLLLARSHRARQVLSQQMRDRQMTKIYRALVGAGPIPDQFTITQPIGRLPYPQLGYIYGASESGKFAESQCWVLKRSPTSTIVEVDIKTGRPHQIRIHLAYAGYPLIGDPLYTKGGYPFPIRKQGSAPIPSDCGYELHACSLRFMHPQGQAVEIHAPIPDRLGTKSTSDKSLTSRNN
jgi:23S rRNA pseudouridine1911/1915/1917 synthase